MLLIKNEAFEQRPLVENLSLEQTGKNFLQKHVNYYHCFPVCLPRETLLRKQNLFPMKHKCFLTNSETFW